MRRPLLLLILLGLGVGGALLATLEGDPPSGSENPRTSGGEERPAGTNTRPMASNGDRTMLPDERPPSEGGGKQAAARLAVPVDMTFQVLEEVSRRPVKNVAYSLAGNGDVVAQADPASNPCRILILETGPYSITFRHASFADQPPYEFQVTADSKPHTVQIFMKRTLGEVSIQVRDRATNAPVKEFEFRVFRKSDGGRLASGATVGSRAQAPVPLDTDVLIQVEAAGYEPSDKQAVKTTAFRPASELTIFLLRHMQFTGIELRVFDATLSPATTVRVVAELRKPNGSFERVWNRKADRANGIYRLPDLRAGTYQLTVRAVSSGDRLDMHVPFVKEVKFTGAEHYVLPVQLKAGARIRLEVQDQQGKTVGRGVKVSLYTAAGDEVRTLWENIDKAGKPLPFAAIGANGLAEDGPAMLWDPVPAGQYRLKVQRGRGEVRTVPITLETGAIKSIRVKLGG